MPVDPGFLVTGTVVRSATVLRNLALMSDFPVPVAVVLRNLGLMSDSPVPVAVVLQNSGSVDFPVPVDPGLLVTVPAVRSATVLQNSDWKIEVYFLVDQFLLQGEKVYFLDRFLPLLMTVQRLHSYRFSNFYCLGHVTYNHRSNTLLQHFPHFHLPLN